MRKVQLVCPFESREIERLVRTFGAMVVNSKTKLFRKIQAGIDRVVGTRNPGPDQACHYQNIITMAIRSDRHVHWHVGLVRLQDGEHVKRISGHDFVGDYDRVYLSFYLVNQTIRDRPIRGFQELQPLPYQLLLINCSC